MKKINNYPGGSIESIIEYNDENQMHGEAKFFSEDGEISLTQQYRNGILVTASNTFKKEEPGVHD
jgi:antitoxin component YwqK of YwqJK toxin-antitoxin module